MSKHERAGAKGRGGRPNLPPHVEAAAPTVETPERDLQLRMPPKVAPRPELPVVEGKRLRCPRAGCGSIHSSVIATSVYDDSTKARMVRRRCRSCRKDFLVHEP